MSLIIAANLIDRIYMCADTRLSRKVEANGIVEYHKVHDNQLKIVPSKNLLVIGNVGSPAMGAFMHKKILELLTPNMHVRELREMLEAKTDQIKLWCEEYLTTTKSSYKDAKCVLVIAGQDPKVKRKAPGPKLMELVSKYQTSTQERLDNLFDKKKPEELTPEEWQKLFRESQILQMGMKDVLYRAVNKNEGNGMAVLDLPDQLIFSLKIDTENSQIEGKTDQIVTFRNFEWGETAVYGANLDENILHPMFFGSLDFRIRSGNLKEDLIWIVEEIHSNFSIETIGGSITNQVLMNEGIFSVVDHLRFMTEWGGPQTTVYHTDMINGELHHKYEGIWSRLIPYTETPLLPLEQTTLSI